MRPSSLFAMRLFPFFKSLRPFTRANRLVSGGAILCLAIGSGVVGAIDDAQLEIERIEGEGWAADNVRFELVLPNNGQAASARIGSVRIAGTGEALRDVRVQCPAIELTADLIACANAQIDALVPQVGKQRLSGSVAYHRRDASIDVDVNAASIAGGSARVKGSMRDGRWRAHVNGTDLQIAELLKLATTLKMPTLMAITASGQVSVTLEASGADAPQSLRINATAKELTANNESGTLASDKLAFTLNAVLTAERMGWDYRFDISSSTGQVYVQPVFVDFGVHAATLSSEGHISEAGAWRIAKFQIDHRDVLQASGSGAIDLEQEQPLRELALELSELKFPGAYESYLQPFLLETDFKSMQTSGRVSGAVQVANGLPQHARLRIDDVSFDDGTRTFALEGLSGDVQWREEDGGPDSDDDVVLRSGSERSTLSWRGGSVLNLSLGAADLQFTMLGRDFRLLEPARIPLLDGAIDLDSLRIRNAGLPSVAFMVDATVQPISVKALCKAFDWPEFGGSVGGTVSKLRLRDGVVTLGTTLQAQVFDGTVAIKDLRLEDTFGKWPRFYSSIAIDNLDLELLTSAFSFGRITGRLSGAINGLQLFNWQPIAFDANLFTPPNDRSKHRISQRAVENIGSIGGGGAGITQALSSGFLRFFEEFRYDRLGLSCRLQNDVCYMNGVAPAPNGGYYLVKGSGLPRIDVIGGARRVDWPRLVQQLIAITESEGPIVQ